MGQVVHITENSYFTLKLVFLSKGENYGKFQIFKNVIISPFLHLIEEILVLAVILDFGMCNVITSSHCLTSIIIKKNNIEINQCQSTWWKWR
jgi:hypothetical protein